MRALETCAAVLICINIIGWSIDGNVPAALGWLVAMLQWTVRKWGSLEKV